MFTTRSGRPLIELCQRLTVTRPLLAASVLGPVRGTRQVRLRLDAGAGATQTLTLVSTKPHLGGRRWWWSCDCGRRCAILLAPEAGDRYLCRTCHQAVYLSAYPSMRPYIVACEVMDLLPGPYDVWDEIARLTAPKQPGVIRGRRVRQRAQRLLATAPPLDGVAAALQLERLNDCLDRRAGRPAGTVELGSHVSTCTNYPLSTCGIAGPRKRGRASTD